jgi:hypothetical protein
MMENITSEEEKPKEETENGSNLREEKIMEPDEESNDYYQFLGVSRGLFLF